MIEVQQEIPKSVEENRTNAIYFFWVIAAVIFTWFLHEFAHWAMSEFLGYNTVLTLNSAYPVSGQHDEVWHSILISAAGPFVTLIQALAVFGHLKYREWVKYFYPFLFVPFYMRLLAGLMNFMNLNDEGRISNFLGIGTFTLPLLISGSLFLMVYLISKKYGLDWKFQLKTTLAVMVVSSVLILADQFWTIRVI